MKVRFSRLMLWVSALVIFGLSACKPSQLPTPTPTATTVPTPTQAPSPTPSLIPDEVITRIDEYYQEMVDKHLFSGSVLIAQGDTILLSEGYGMADLENNIPNTPQTRFYLASLSKQITAAAVMILQAQGKLDVHDPVCSYVPDCPEDWEPITIHQLLTHTSGLTYHIYMAQNIPGIYYSPEEILSWNRDTLLQFEPGERYVYSNTGYILLGYLIEEVSGQSYSQFVQQEIFEPLGMVDSGYYHEDAETAVGYQYYGVEADYLNVSLYYSAAGLYSTVEDMYKWDRSFYSEEILPAEFIEAIFTPYPPEASIESTSTPDVNAGYGYGWAVVQSEELMFADHSGMISGGLTYIFHYPSDEIVIIILSNFGQVLKSTFDFPLEEIFGD